MEFFRPNNKESGHGKIITHKEEKIESMSKLINEFKVQNVVESHDRSRNESISQMTEE